MCLACLAAGSKTAPHGPWARICFHFWSLWSASAAKTVMVCLTWQSYDGVDDLHQMMTSYLFFMICISTLIPHARIRQYRGGPALHYANMNIIVLFYPQ